MRLYTPVALSTDSRPKWAKCITVFKPKQRKNPALWGGTYLYGLKGSTPSRAFHARFLVSAIGLKSDPRFSCLQPVRPTKFLIAGRNKSLVSRVHFWRLTIKNCLFWWLTVNPIDPPMARLAYYNCVDTWLPIGKSCVLSEVVQWHFSKWMFFGK